jgi:hypothetical protein
MYKAHIADAARRQHSTKGSPQTLKSELGVTRFESRWAMTLPPTAWGGGVPPP